MGAVVRLDAMTWMRPFARLVFVSIVTVALVGCATSGSADSSSTEARSGASNSAEGGTAKQGESSESGTATHYAFAHIFLRTVFYEEPEALLKRLQGPEAKKILIAAWDNVAQRTKTTTDLEPSDFVVHTAQNESAEQTTYLAIVEMPEPRETTEAFMIGMICRPPDGTLRPQESPCRYYTLEKSAAELLAKSRDDYEGGPETSMGGWTDEPVTHVNYEAAPPADVSAFRKEVEEHFERYLQDR